MSASHKAPTVRESMEAFKRALIEYRDSILIDMVAQTVASAENNNPKVGRATEWGNKKQWKKTASSVGASSKMSTVDENDEGVEQKFQDDLSIAFPSFLVNDSTEKVFGYASVISSSISPASVSSSSVSPASSVFPVRLSVSS